MTNPINPNWCDLPAGLNLDRLIAERLGWREIKRRDIYEEGYDWGGFYPRLFGRSPTPLYPIGTDLIPQYSTDANAALTLVKVDNFQLEYWHGQWRAGAYLDNSSEDAGWEYADSPALAICRAWLAVQEIKE